MDLTTCEDEGTYMQLFEMSFTSPPFDTGFHSIHVTTDEEEEEEEAHIENEVEVVEIERSLWECPCCRNNHVAALALPCDHLVCVECITRSIFLCNPSSEDLFQTLTFHIRTHAMGVLFIDTYQLLIVNFLYSVFFLGR